MFMFRELTAEEIECRIQQVKTNGISLLLYKDARCDQNILDETVGAYNWMRSHSRDNANCTVSIWDDKKQQWISKEDTGVESNTEARKGLASDSFKRACFNWGIGRELYTAPFIWVKSDRCKIENGKCNDKFDVKEISYRDGEIVALTIVNSKTGAVVYKMGEKLPDLPKEPEEVPKAENKPEPAPQRTQGDVLFRCEICGAVLKPYIGKNNKEVSVEKHAARSAEMFGKTLCIDCINKKQAGESA